MAPPRTPTRIVLMGGIGSGKSTVGRMLADRGALVIDADAIGHSVLEPEGEAFAAVAETWPDVVVDGRVDRRRLADIVFRDPEELRRLEEVTHPAIRRRILELAEKAGDRPVVVELPLMRRFLPGDWVRVLVDAPEEVRIRRVVGRGGDEGDARRRLALQPSRQEWRRSADIVIENDADLETLRRRVDDLWARMTAPEGMA